MILGKGKSGKNLEVSGSDLQRLKDTITNRRSAFNITEWMFLKKTLRLKDRRNY